MRAKKCPICGKNDHFIHNDIHDYCVDCGVSVFVEEWDSWRVDGQKFFPGDAVFWGHTSPGDDRKMTKEEFERWLKLRAFE